MKEGSKSNILIVGDRSLPHTSRQLDAVRGARILLVEDSKTIRLATEGLLKGEGFFVTTAGNGKEAVELIKEKVFDMVLMDIEMPVKDGHTAAREIRKWENRTKSSVSSFQFQKSPSSQ